MANVVEIVIKGIDKTREGFVGPINGLGDLSKRLTQIKPLFLTVAAAAAAAFGAMAKQFIDGADQAGKLAQKLGLSTEALTSLQYAAKAADVETSSFTAGMKALSEKMVDGSTALAALGVQARDFNGNLRSADEVLLDVADRFADLSDGAQKTALAVDLFGKAGMDMIPLLSQGSAGIKEMQEEAKLLGLVISKDTAEHADKFKSSLELLADVGLGAVADIVSHMLPTLAKWAEGAAKAAKESWILKGAVATVKDIFDLLISTGRGVVFIAQRIGEAFELVGRYIGNAASDMVNGYNIISGVLVKLGEAIKDVFTGKVKKGVEALDQVLPVAQQKFEIFRLGLQNTGKQIVKDWNDLWAKIDEGPKSKVLEAEFKSKNTSISTYKAEPFDKEILPGADKFEQMGQKEREIRASLLEGMDEISARSEALYAQRRNEIEKLAIAEDEKNQLVNKLDAKSKNDLWRAQLAYYSSQASQFGQVLGNFAAVAEAAGKKNGALYKALMYGYTVVSTAAAVMRVIAEGGMFAIPLSASIAAMGAVQLATISSAKMGGAAHGGMDYIPEESTFLLQRGERVLSPKQNTDLTDFLGNQQNGGGSSSGPQMIQNIINVDGAKFFEIITQASRDGRLSIHSGAIA